MSIRDLEKIWYGKFLLIIKRCFGADYAKNFDLKLRFHKKVNLKNPQSLADKIIWIENHVENQLTTDCSDKILVREYVKENGFADTLVPVFGTSYDNVENIPFNDLPDRCVIKANHGSKMNYFCNDKKLLDVKKCKKQLKKWLQMRYGSWSAEWHYLNIHPKIYIEHMLDDTDKMIDYKFHCMNGKPYFILVMSNRDATSHATMSMNIDLYDMNWENHNEFLCASNLETPGKGNIQKPQNFERMVQMATTLSMDFAFVRVDLYEISGKLFFGELTFTPGAGLNPFLKDEFQQKMGALLDISVYQVIEKNK